MRTIELKNQKEGFDLGIKRFYTTGSYTVTCPNCQSSMIDDLNEDYFNYPVIGENTSRYLYCYNCESAYNLDVKLISISVEIENDESKLEPA
jgi:hypothetical protein